MDRQRQVELHEYEQLRMQISDQEARLISSASRGALTVVPESYAWLVAADCQLSGRHTAHRTFSDPHSPKDPPGKYLSSCFRRGCHRRHGEQRTSHMASSLTY